MASILHNTVEDDEFGSVENDDLILAENSNATSTTGLRSKRTTPLDFEDHSRPKKLRANDDRMSASLAEQILQRTWGFSQFRLKQQQAICRLIDGGSAVVVFPTGGGKSLVYQVPALAFNDYDKHCGRSPGGGITLVVSPLIALMKVRPAEILPL